jgi:SAM-dependent methyltransferase
MAPSPMTEMLDLDVEVLHEFHRDVISWVGSLTTDRPRIVDLGAGTGAGSLALARHLPGARVTAVDVDDEMLDHLRQKAERAGVADRVRTVRADLDQPWPDLGPADLVWASASMHHLADPARALAQVAATLTPGGLFAISELDSFPRFFTEPAAAAVEDRAHAALAHHRAEAGMHMGEDWGARLTAAGFTVEASRRFDIALEPPLPAAAGRYAQVAFQRMRQGLESRVDAADLAAIETLAAEAPERTDLTVRTVREVWLGRRP